MAQHDPATVASYELELPIQAKRDVVWEALTVSINEWWLPDFRILGPDSRVELDPVLGGHIAEHGDALVGVMSETQLTSLQSGWKQLFGDGLAAWVTRAAQ